jgi:cyclopropane fatty-acyl-phospholipid synthase-like methyltransferase
MIRRLFFELLYLLRKARWDSGISPPELFEYLKTATPGRALDLGCGTGTNVITMAQYGWDVIGVDFSARAIKAARRKARPQSADVQFIQSDVTQLEEVQGTFNLILDIGCFHTLSLPARKRYEENLAHFLQPGGTYLLYAHLDRLGLDDSPKSSEGEICEFFKDVCTCINVVTGSDSASQHHSAWFTMSRVS